MVPPVTSRVHVRPVRFLDRPGDAARDTRQPLPHRTDRNIAGQRQPRQIGAHRAGWRGNRHVVVVEDDDQPRIHARRHCSSPHRPCRPTSRRRRSPTRHGWCGLQIARHGHAKTGGDRRRGMGRAERVIFAFGALGEARQPAALAKRADAVAPSGQDLVRIALVPDIPDQPVIGVSKTACMATVSSTTPSPAPRWPPVARNDYCVRRRSSPRAR
jgi:hypothetical protein